MSDILKGFRDGKLIITVILVLISYGITGGIYLKSIDDSINDIKKIRFEFNSHKILVLTQLGILNTEIVNIRRELNSSRRATRFGRFGRKNNPTIYGFDREPM